MSADTKGHLLLSMAVSLVFLCVACWSCSVLEDRDDCPCLLVLDLGHLRGQGRFPVTVAVSGNGGFFYTDTLWKEDAEFDYYLEVPRGEAMIYAVNAGEGFFVPGYGLKITSGAQCPKVWMNAHRVILDRERCRDTLRLNKNYCLLDIRISESGNKTLGWPFLVEVSGGVDGYDTSGSPSFGRFAASVWPSKEGKAPVSVPRQVDNSLRLDITNSSGVLRSFALGEFIAESGYDWNAENLEDLPVQIDYASTSITVKIDLWQKTIPFEIVI